MDKTDMVIIKKFENDPMFHRFCKGLFSTYMDGWISVADITDAVIIVNELIKEAQKQGHLPLKRKTPAEIELEIKQLQNTLFKRWLVK